MRAISEYLENRRAEKANKQRGDEDLRRREVEALEEIALAALAHTRPLRDPE